MQRTLVKNTLDKIGSEVVLKGWVDTKRDHGNITFIDLRDYTGKIQCVGKNGVMGKVSTEFVVMVKGEVKERPENMVNSDIDTGTIELKVLNFEIINKAEEIPIPLDTDGLEIGEEPRLDYRYLDLRRERMQNNMRMRSKLASEFRSYLNNQDFVEIETPILTKATKEGARDFVVPSRNHPGKFYALPQSPQQYKQLLMSAGFEKYYQFARAIRDEDLRADRGYEHTQIDIEMSFVEQKDILTLAENGVKQSVKAVGAKLKDENFPVIDYKDAINKYGADKFDLRTNEEKQEGILAFAWVVNFPFFKKTEDADEAEKQDTKSNWTFTHNPFSNPIKEHIEQHKNMEDIGEIVTNQYDLVCNGYEVGGGSIRAHDPKVLEATYKIMGYSDEEIKNSVGHMLKAFRLGTPPHGGIALGLDRLAMVVANEESLKEVIAFPMTSSGRTAVMDAPGDIGEELLDELHLQIKSDQ